MEFNKFKLKELLQVNPRITLKKGSKAKKIAMENIKEFQKKIDNFTIEEFKSGSKFQNGDTLLARITPCLENGKTAYVDILEDDEIAFGSTEFFVLRPIDNKLDSQFLYYLFRTKKIREIIIKSMTGTSGRQRAQKDSILEYECEVPTIEYQRKIAIILKNLDDKIEINKKIITNLEELSQTLFKHWFVDFEFPDKDGNPYKSSGGEMIDSELGEIPLNWNINELKNIADIRTGYAFKSSEYIYSSKLSVLRTLNISKTSCLIEMNNLKFVSNDYINIPKYNKYSLEIFDTLLVTVGGTIGNIGIITESNLPSLQNQNMWRFRTLNSKINNPLIYNIIKIINKKVSNQTSGSAREFYTKKVFENFKIALPNLNDPMLLKANQIHSNIFNTISNLNKETNNLVQLRDNLLPKLMSGELEIPDDMEVNMDEFSI